MESIYLERYDMRDKIKILCGDIGKIKVDAIICQSNTDLEADDEITAKLMELGGNVVQAECNRIENIEKSQAIVTTAGNLPAKYLIHAVFYNLGEQAEEEALMLSVRNGLNLVKEKQLKTISMPLIGESSIIPIKRAAELMLAEVKRHLEADTSIEKIIFVLQDQASYEALQEGYLQL